MSYRIYLSIVNKIEYKKIIAREDSLYMIGDNHIELYDGTHIERFKKIRKFKNDEYCPYILKKKNILEIISDYKKQRYNDACEKLKRITKLRDYFNEYTRRKSNLSIDINMVRDLSDLFFSDFSLHSYLQIYFDDKYNKKNILIKESGLFLLDYFKLVEMYNVFDEKNDVAVITHG